MTKRERVLAVLSGERPDRPPIFECVAHDGILEHFGGQPIGVGDVEGVVRACSRFLDLSHPAMVPQAPREEPGHVVERWSTWTLPTGTMDDAEMISAMKRGIEDAEAWQPDPKAIAAFRTRARQINAWAGDMVYIHIGAGPTILPFSIEQGIFAYADYPELARRWNRTRNESALRQIETTADKDLSPVCILWTDIAFKNKLFYPPDVLRELFYPHLKAQVDLFHSKGMRVVYHSDGDVTEALKDLVACGIDGFNPLEISAGMTLDAFTARCGKKVALVGGIDAVDTLARGTPKQVAEETRQLLRRFPDGGLMVASSSGEIDDSMPTENVLAMYETVWNYGKD
jgi:hypothetical protein